MTTIAPNKITLTCTITGKQTTWLNRALIQKAIDKHGSLEAFMAQYVSRGAKKNADVVVKAKIIKPILEQGKRLGEMTRSEYETKYVTRKYTNKDGTITTVTAPAMPAPKMITTNDVVHAAQKAVDAIAG